MAVKPQEDKDVARVASLILSIHYLQEQEQKLYTECSEMLKQMMQKAGEKA